MGYVDVDTSEVQGSEWIKIGVDTGAGKTAWLQSVTYGKKLLGHVDSHSAQQQESLSSLASDCTLKVATIGESISEFEVFKRRCLSQPLLSVGDYTTLGGVTVLYGDKGYMFHKGSNVAKKIDAWIQKETRDSQNRGCTVAYKEINVYNICMKQRGNKTDAMPLSEDSDNRYPAGYWPGSNLQDQKIQIQKIQEEQEEHTIQYEMMHWMVKSLWCRGCQIYLLNPVRDRSPNTS